MKIGIKATQIVPGGGLAHVRKLLEHRPGSISPGSVIVYLSEKQRGMFDDLQSRCSLRFYKFPAINGLFRLFWEQCILPFIIQRDQVDLLFEPGNMGIIFSTVKRVLLIHNIAPFDEENIRRESFRQKIRLRLLAFVTTVSARKSAGVVFLSEHTKALLSKKFKKYRYQEVVINHGVDHDMVERRQQSADIMFDDEAPFIFCASHIYRYKNFETLLEAFAIIKASHSGPLRLLIAGENYDPKYFAKLDTIMRQRSLSADVEFLGNVSEETLRSFYQRCELFIFPSVLESCPIIMIEAMRESACVLASDIEVISEVCGDSAVYFAPRDAGRLADLALMYLGDEVKRQTMKEKARARSNNYDWKKTASDTFSFLEKLINSSNCAGKLTLIRHASQECEIPGGVSKVSKGARKATTTGKYAETRMARRMAGKNTDQDAVEEKR